MGAFTESEIGCEVFRQQDILRRHNAQISVRGRGHKRRSRTDFEISRAEAIAMAPKLSAPTFGQKSVLIRYVFPEQRLAKNFPSAAAFQTELPTTEKPKPYLSVNSTEAEKVGVIAEYHRNLFQGGKGRVAHCEHTVRQYNEAGIKCDVDISFDRESAKWEFRLSATSKEDAYRHIPNMESDKQFKSWSHSGVQFVQALAEHNKSKFARRMVKQKFHLR